MPLYEFRCSDGDNFETSYPMSAVPDQAACPQCGGQARRQMSTPRLSIANSAAFRLIDSTARSAHEPQVVSSGAPGGGHRGPQYTRNPLHQKLPRP